MFGIAFYQSNLVTLAGSMHNIFLDFWTSNYGTDAQIFTHKPNRNDRLHRYLRLGGIEHGKMCIANITGYRTETSLFCLRSQYQVQCPNQRAQAHLPLLYLHWPAPTATPCDIGHALPMRILWVAKNSKRCRRWSGQFLNAACWYVGKKDGRGASI